MSQTMCVCIKPETEDLSRLAYQLVVLLPTEAAGRCDHMWPAARGSWQGSDVGRAGVYHGCRTTVLSLPSQDFWCMGSRDKHSSAAILLASGHTHIRPCFSYMRKASISWYVASTQTGVDTCLLPHIAANTVVPQAPQICKGCTTCYEAAL